MSGNVAGHAFALTMMCPIKAGTEKNVAFADAIRNQLEIWNGLPTSPMVKIPNTYLCRYYVVDDVFSQSLPGGGFWDNALDLWPFPINDRLRLAALPYEDHLKSRYLVFSSNFHGDLEPYLEGMWRTAEAAIRSVWQHCYGFEHVVDAVTFIDYAKRCQVDTSLFFVGSNDDSLAAQLKALYVKQEFSRFAQETQDMPAAELRRAYLEFMQRVKPRDDAGLTWKSGQRT